MQKGGVLFFILIFQFFGHLYGQTQPKKVSSAVTNTAISFMLGGTVDVSKDVQEKWLGPLIESALEFKLGALPELNFISSNQVKKNVPGFKTISGPISEREYFDVAKKLNVTYVGKAKFELSSNKDLFYYLEIISVKNMATVSTVEREFKYEKIGTAIDEIVNEIVKSLKVEVSKDLIRFLKLPVLSEDTKNLKQFGDCILAEKNLQTAELSKVVETYKAIVDKDHAMLLAYWQGGFSFEQAGLYREAAELFNQVLITFPECNSVYLPLCRNYREAGRMEDALKIIGYAEQRGIKLSAIFVEKALVLDALGKKNEAESAFKTVLAFDPDNILVLLHYAKKSNDAGNGTEAFDYCNRILKTEKESPDVLNELGRSYILLKKTDLAINAFQRSSQLDDKRATSYVCLGDLYLSLNSFDKASVNYEKAINLTDGNVDLYLNAARAFGALGNTQRALAILKKAVSKYADNGIFAREIGLLELTDKDTITARTHLETSMRASAADERVLNALGWIYLNSNEFDKAFTMFTRVLPQLKDKTKCKLGLIQIHLHRLEYAPAVVLLDELFPAVVMAGAYKKVADFYYGQNDKAHALQYYKKEISISKSDTAVQNKIAEITYESGAYQESKAAYSELIKMGRDDASITYRLAIIALRLKDRAAAANYVTLAAKKGTTDAETYYKLGLGFKELGATQDAAVSFERCLSIDSKHEKAMVQLLPLLESMQKDSAAAELNLKLFALNNDKYKDNLITAGMLFEKKNLISQAKNAYTQFIEKKYVNPEINCKLAKLEFKNKNFSAVQSLLQNIQPIHLDTPTLLLALEVYNELQQYQKVIQFATVLFQKAPDEKRALELCAIAYEKTGAVESAIPLYRKSLASSGANAESAFHLGELYEKIQHYKNAIEYYTSILKTYPKEYRIFDHLARLSFSAGDWNNATIQLQQALAFKNAASDLNLLLARSFSKQNNFSGATDAFKKYLQNNRGDTTAWYECGILFFNHNDFKNSAFALSNAVAGGMQNNYTVQRSLGTAYFQIKDLTNATAPLEKALELKPNDKEVMGLLAACYRAGSNREGLANLLTEWCAVDKNNFDIRRELGELYFADSKLPQATAILEEALNLKPCTIDLHLLLANIYEVQNTLDQWGGHLRNALGCDSKNPDLLFEISRYFESLKDTARVMEYLQQTLQLAPAHGEANYKMGYLLLQKNNVSEALNYLSKAVKANPTSKNLIALSEAYFKLNRKADALTVIRPILSKINDPQVLRWAGTLYKENGFLDSAQQLLEKSIQNDNKCVECYIALADLLFDSYSFIDAAKNYQSAIDLGAANEKVLIKAARTYSMIGKDDAARKIFETLVAGNFPNDEVMYRLCHLYIHGNQIDRARTLLERMDTKSGWYYLASGELLETDVGGDREQIVNAFRKANELLPDISEVQAGFGRISLAKNDFNMAIEYFAKAMGGDPENCQYMIDMGKAYEGIKEYPSAMDLYKEVERRQPGNSEVDVLIARLVSKKSDHFEAIMTIKDKIEKNKRNGLLYIELGNEYRLINQFQDAIDAYSKAIKYDEKQCVEAYRYLGLVFNDRGDQKKAKKNFENYINLGGQDKSVNALLKKYK